MEIASSVQLPDLLSSLVICEVNVETTICELRIVGFEMETEP